jgi:hypothetical protein
MSPSRPCPLEPDVLAAQRSGEWRPSLRRHAESCPPCADALLASAYLGALAADAGARALERGSLPDASRLLWRARLRQRGDQAAGAAARATWPIRLLNRVTAAAGAAFAGAVLTHQGPRLAEWLASLRRSAALENAPPAASPEALALAAGGLLFAVLLFALYSAWAEE